MRVRRSHDVIAVDARVHDLADAVAVGEAHDKTVLGRVVLALVLDHQAQTLTVVSLALRAATLLGLIALEVRLVLHNLLERHFFLKLTQKHTKTTTKMNRWAAQKEKERKKEKKKKVFF